MFRQKAIVNRQSQIVRSDSQFNLQTQQKYRQSSPCKHDAIDNALQSYSAMVNETLIAQSENSNFFDVKVHLFCI